ncbi:hypothetical protein DLE60_02620 [Micromonospora globispora]|uniref:Uncharacterized protein n=1 Tax=Micromonospora globispora TaxID=1450148 RepID=A0A317JUH5_9ACTN|nr:hypothetical protein DLJ46_28210 [Micromonospora globispora]PWU62015.1 hypothetical protein DLE60_02620 [Micromonospora globispora]
MELLTAADLADPRPLYEVDLAAAGDEPGDVGVDEISYPDWLAAYWHRCNLNRELTSPAFVDGVVAAFGRSLIDGRHGCRSRMTGTRPAHHGAGLAGLVKLAALPRAWGPATGTSRAAPLSTVECCRGGGFVNLALPIRTREWGIRSALLAAAERGDH